MLRELRSDDTPVVDGYASQQRVARVTLYMPAALRARARYAVIFIHAMLQLP